MPLVTVAAGAAIGLGIAVGGPAALGVIGYTATGITAGSTAAGMMSAAAAANGGGVAAGGVVATLQSIGAAGLGLGTTVGVAGVCTAIAALFL